jgi:hypothetical protein
MASRYYFPQTTAEPTSVATTNWVPQSGEQTWNINISFNILPSEENWSNCGGHIP